MYGPKVRRLDSVLRTEVKDADWGSFPSMLIGFDVYVDVDGNVGFYEGNSIPFALVEYEQMFDEALGDNLAKGLKGKTVGINSSPSYMSASLWEEAECAERILKRNGVDVVFGHPLSLSWDNKKNKFYFNDFGSIKHFDVLFNRHPGGHKRLREQVPQSKWYSAPVISPLSHTYVLANKSRTGRALRKFGLETPLAFVVRNDEERNTAVDKIMTHIEENHSNYEAPFILTKPVCGTGARNVRVHRNRDSNFSGVEYPYLISERITVSPMVMPDGRHSIDARMFFTHGFASQAVGRMSGYSIDQNPFYHKAFITNICKGGKTVVFDPKVEKALGEYVLAAALAINERAKEVPEEVK